MLSVSKDQENNIVIAAFYHFAAFDDFEAWRKPLHAFCVEHDLKGTILLAKEGVNSTISGTRENIDALFDYLKKDIRFVGLEWKESYANFQPFLRMKVRLKKEIVRMGLEDLDTTKRGQYVTPEEWGALIQDPEVIVVDTRNDYEVKIGTFKGAINPNTQNFRDFPEWVENNLDPKSHKKVAMFCTGGIRCEKSTALLKQMGFDDVYHLKGGILQYLEDTQNKESLWEGDCFVFDDRVAVNADLEPTNGVLCEKCGVPMGTDDLKISPKNQIVCIKCAN